MAQLMPILETRHNFSWCCAFSILMVDSSDSGSYSERCERVIQVSLENQNFWVFNFKTVLQQRLVLISLYTLCNFQELLFMICPNLPTQKYFCKNANHLNLFCIIFVEDIVVKSQNCWTRLWWGPTGLVISFPLFMNQLILASNPATYWLKHWFLKFAFQWYIIWPYFIKLIEHWLTKARSPHGT